MCVVESYLIIDSIYNIHTNTYIQLEVRLEYIFVDYNPFSLQFIHLFIHSSFLTLMRPSAGKYSRPIVL